MRVGRALPIALAGLLCACGSGLRTLNMAPLTPAWVDESSISPSLRTGSFDRIMIVPPSGTAGVQFEENLAAIERSFIARGVTVISSAITSRVLADDRTRTSAQSGIGLSELERALLLAQESRVDAILQIGMWEWLESGASELGARCFMAGKGEKAFREVECADSGGGSEEVQVRSFAGPVLTFTGRFIDVESGEVLASFKIDVPTVNVADPLTVSFDGDGNVVGESYMWADERRRQAAAGRAVSELFDRLAGLISSAGS
jgi:hypothetical protein